MRTISRRALALLGALLLSAPVASAASADVALTQVSSDPFTSPATGQHATEVEPDTFAAGSTVVSAFQVARFVDDGGAAAIGFATSRDGGATWTQGLLPGLTSAQGTSGSPYARVTDSSVAYDARDHVWLVSSLPIPAAPGAPATTIFVSRSTDGGLTWGPPVSTPPPSGKRVSLDKNWTACDNSPSSPYYGHCYTETDDFGDHGVMLVSTSTDGGLTWGTPIPTRSNDKGVGGQPVVRPDGTVVVPYESYSGKISAYRSLDGGASWTSAVNVTGIRFHTVAGGLRTTPLPTAEVDAAGRVYVAWEDCRFRTKCASNDIVFSSSRDGVTWRPVRRIPLDPVTSTVDHFVPGLAVDPATSGASAHLGLTYYFYPDASCATGCDLSVGSSSSPDGGAHWAAGTTITGPMSLTDLARTPQGPMVGDYISSSFVPSGDFVTIIAVGKPRAGATYDEAMYSPGPLAVAPAAAVAGNPALATGVQVAVTGEGTGPTHHSLKVD